ncbi:MAG: hypothetical protein A2Y67_02370 [Candidatus Buchananbacteria bacterium RBG_13_39_9]|jgi:RNA polymerase sigma-70 factor (ECF subfamily)|uniref:RNA polymerase sigma factor n=1 Tax=Candidatus Buchananbacteria bacterium RBG_13_39_9 TaxID=1797531 RepID=A0A1G1XRF8_9BACT|nr:MAG: hypothetical protein A2Y67_02370 [Candidatus Buchananbacteria bacterium RBG_13_39_9]
MNSNFFKEQYLLFRAKNKDPEAYSKIYDYYVQRIFRFVFFKVNNQEEAQDLTSEVFLKTWQYIIDGKEIKNLNAFFYKIARNLVIDYYRKSQQKGISLETLRTESEALENLEKDKLLTVSHKELDDQMQLEKIKDKLQYLKDEYREILVLRYIDGLTIKEIAEIVAKKKGAVRVIIYRATNALKELMEEK